MEEDTERPLRPPLRNDFLIFKQQAANVQRAIFSSNKERRLESHDDRLSETYAADSQAIPFQVSDIIKYSETLRVCVIAGMGVTDLHGFTRCVKLVKLDAHQNQISSLPPVDTWKKMVHLEVLYLHDNQVASLQLAEQLQGAVNLRFLTMHNNPVCLDSNYRCVLVNLLSSLLVLDHHVIADEEIIEGVDASSVPRFKSQSSFMEIDIYLVPKESTEEELLALAKLRALVTKKIAHHSPVIVLQRYCRGWHARRKFTMMHPHLELPSAPWTYGGHKVHHPAKRSPLEMYFPAISPHRSVTTLHGIHAKWLIPKYTLPTKRSCGGGQPAAQAKSDNKAGQKQYASFMEVRGRLENLGITDGRNLHQQYLPVHLKRHQLPVSLRRSPVPLQQMSSSMGRKLRLTHQGTQHQITGQQCHSDFRADMATVNDGKRRELQELRDELRQSVQQCREKITTDDERRYSRLCASVYIRNLSKHTNMSELAIPRTGHLCPPQRDAFPCAPKVRVQRQQEDTRMIAEEWKASHKEKVGLARDARAVHEALKLNETTASRSNASCAAKIKSVKYNFDRRFTNQMSSLTKALQKTSLAKQRSAEQASLTYVVACQRGDERKFQKKVRMQRKWNTQRIAIGRAAERFDLEAEIAAQQNNHLQAARATVGQLREEARERVCTTADDGMTLVNEKRHTALAVKPVDQVKLEEDKSMQANNLFPTRAVHISTNGIEQSREEFCSCPPQERVIVKADN